MRQKICDSCGKEIQEDFKLCPYCGKEFEVQEILLSNGEPSESKVKKYDIKKKISILPIISGILTFLSLIFPAAYSSYETPFVKVKVNSYLWIWGFAYSIKGFVIIEKGGFYELSFFISFCLLVLGVFTFGIERLFKKNKIPLTYVQKIWPSIGILQILFVLIWILFLEIAFPGIWSIYSMGFGIIGLFISATLLIVSGVILEIYKELIPEIKKEKTPKEKKKYKPDKFDFILFGILGFFAVVIIIVIVLFLSS